MDIQEILGGLGGNPALSDIAAKLGVSPDQAQATVQGVLEHLGAGNAVESVADGVAAKMGISPDLVNQALPGIMGMLQNHAASGEAGAGGLANMLGGLVGGQGGSALDGVMGMAKGLFGKS